MANKDFHGKVFKSVDEVKEILPVDNAGIVVVKEKRGLRVCGGIFTEKDGNYEDCLDSARIGAQNLNPGRTVEVIMV